MNIYLFLIAFIFSFSYQSWASDCGGINRSGFLEIVNCPECIGENTDIKVVRIDANYVIQEILKGNVNELPKVGEIINFNRPNGMDLTAPILPKDQVVVFDGNFHEGYSAFICVEYSLDVQNDHVTGFILKNKGWDSDPKDTMSLDQLRKLIQGQYAVAPKSMTCGFNKSSTGTGVFEENAMKPFTLTKNYIAYQFSTTGPLTVTNIEMKKDVIITALYDNASANVTILAESTDNNLSDPNQAPKKSTYQSVLNLKKIQTFAHPNSFRDLNESEKPWPISLGVACNIAYEITTE